MTDIVFLAILAIMFIFSLTALITPTIIINLQVKIFKLLLSSSFQGKDLHLGGTEPLRLLKEDPQIYKNQYQCYVQIIRLSGFGFLFVSVIGLWILGFSP
jgi:hypothetical protein